MPLTENRARSRLLPREKADRPSGGGGVKAPSRRELARERLRDCKDVAFAGKK